jgi:hypothetical protein
MGSFIHTSFVLILPIVSFTMRSATATARAYRPIGP